MNTAPIFAKCDYLTVTYSPEDSPAEEIKADFLQYDATIDYDTGKKCVLSIGETATVAIELRGRFHYVSISGSMLEHLRTIGRYDSMLSLLSTSPHKVTRLDAAYDVPIDAPELLAALIKASPSGNVNLTRKGVKMKEIMSVRDDGKRSGTLYYGYRSQARVTACVYDKALEALEKRGEVLPPTTRYEITVKDGQATLNDAYNPTALFWHFASPVLLPLPNPAPAPWVSGGELIGWEYKPPETLPLDILEKYIDKMMPTLNELSNVVGAYGHETTLYLIAKKLGIELPSAPVRKDKMKSE